MDHPHNPPGRCFIVKLMTDCFKSHNFGADNMIFVKIKTKYLSKLFTQLFVKRKISSKTKTFVKCTDTVTFTYIRLMSDVVC